MKIKIGNFDCTECWDGVFYKKLSAFPKITERLILRRWTEADTESLEVIRNVFCGSECYAVCKKEDNKATYEKETKRSFRKKIFNAENWNYDAEQKEYTCPCGNPVPYKKTETRKNHSGYLQTYDVYQCDNCEGCPFRELCTKSEYGRIIQRNENWIFQKTKVKELLATAEYKKLMKKRSTECETVFGQIKANLKFRRFHLRGKEKVGIEWGLLMIGYDFKQIIRQLAG